MVAPQSEENAAYNPARGSYDAKQISPKLAGYSMFRDISSEMDLFLCPGWGLDFGLLIFFPLTFYLVC